MPITAVESPEDHTKVRGDQSAPPAEVRGSRPAAKIFISKIVPSPRPHWGHQVDVAVGF